MNVICLSFSSIDADQTFKNKLIQKVELYKQNKDSTDLNKIQDTLKCCGIDSVEDYLDEMNENPYKIPISCCISLGYSLKCEKLFVYNTGCYVAYLKEVSSQRKFAIFSNILIIVFQIEIVAFYGYMLKRALN